MVPPEVLLVAIAVALSVWIGGQIAHGAKVVGHKAKCGVMHVVGKACDPPAEDAAK